MLNTDLHRATDDGAKKKRKKMTKDEFIRNLRGADQGENIDRDILSSMYDNILASPIEMEVQSSELSITEDSSKEKADTEISTNGVADESKFASDVSKGLRDAEDVLRSLSIFTHRFQMTAVDVNISMDLVRFMFDAVWMNIHAVTSCAWHPSITTRTFEHSTRYNHLWHHSSYLQTQMERLALQPS